MVVIMMSLNNVAMWQSWWCNLLSNNFSALCLCSSQTASLECFDIMQSMLMVITLWSWWLCSSTAMLRLGGWHVLLLCNPPPTVPSTLPLAQNKMCLFLRFLLHMCISLKHKASFSWTNLTQCWKGWQRDAYKSIRLVFVSCDRLTSLCLCSTENCLRRSKWQSWWQ